MSTAYRSGANVAVRVEKRAYFAVGGGLTMALVADFGLYGALAFYVNTRRRELALRVCFGALPWAIRKIILERAARCGALAAVISAPLWPVLALLSSTEYLGQVSWPPDAPFLFPLLASRWQFSFRSFLRGPRRTLRPPKY